MICHVLHTICHLKKIKILLVEKYKKYKRGIETVWNKI